MAESCSTVWWSIAELIPGLPDDLAIHLLRVSRPHHVLLRCVCRRWRSLLSLPTFFDLRIKHNLSQEWLYVMLRTSTGEYKWISFIDGSHLWLPLPPLPEPKIGPACAVADGKLYMIGGSQGQRLCRSVWAFDPRFNSWQSVAPMKVARKFAAAGVLAGQIHTYNPHTNEWTTIPSPPEKRYKWFHESAVLQNKLFAVADMGGVVGGEGQQLEDTWLEVQGWQKDVPKVASCAMLTNVGGKLYVLWEIPKSGWEA
ncbi:hypothetical protein KP509_22G041400 [Ceratopteris richardii]|uniref:F-box domain-containing protein n=1 Tax=Ceratopteris richardii TaxID=49495 RepID=A0A8T2S498_CERRI|nr:hypothetical protein KP509_22G041400 [Ceratopteris richardii]